MNRRMVKAKSARKWHAARERQVRRFIDAAMARISDSLAASIKSHATLGDALRDATRAMQGFVVEAVAHRAMRQVMASLPRYHSGGVVGLRPNEVPAVILPPGQLFAREPDGTRRHLGTTGPITLRLGHDPLPDQRCTCTFTRVVKTDSQGVPRHVDVPGPTCDWCQRQPPPPALPDCGVCGEPIRPDRMTGTTCGCAPGSRGRTWSPLMCECTGTGPTCGYCRGHGVP